MGQKAIRVGLFGIVVLGTLAVAQPAGALPSCLAAIQFPMNQTTSTCGDSLTEDVAVGPVFNVTGEQIASAVANLGILQGAATTFMDTDGTGFGGLFIVTQLGQGTFADGAVFILDDLVVSGSPGSEGQPVDISFNIAVTGTLFAGGSDRGVGSQANFSVEALFGTPFGLIDAGGVLSTDNSGGFSATGILSSIAAPGAIDTVVTTPAGTEFVGGLFGFRLGMKADSLTLTGDCFGLGGCVGHSVGTSDFSQGGVRFPCTTPVANLPDGFTLNSLSGVIVDNQFQGCLAGSSGTVEAPQRGH